MSRWWRAYDEAVDDPKLGALTDRQHRAWFNLCCITSQNGGKLPPIPAIAFKLRTTVEKAKAILAELIALRLFDMEEGGSCAPHNWDQRQYKTDVTDPTAASRAKRYRDKKRDASRDASRDDTVTQPVTDKRPETEADTEQISSLRSDSAPAKPKRSTKARNQLPNLWQPDEQDVEYACEKGFAGQKLREMASAFANHHRSRGSLMADWHAAWRTWCENEIKFQSKRDNGNGRRTVHDAARDLHENLLERIAEFDEPAPRSIRGPEGSDVVRLLPARGRE